MWFRYGVLSGSIYLIFVLLKTMCWYFWKLLTLFILIFYDLTRGPSLISLMCHIYDEINLELPFLRCPKTSIDYFIDQTLWPFIVNDIATNEIVFVSVVWEPCHCFHTENKKKVMGWLVQKILSCLEREHCQLFFSFHSGGVLSNFTTLTNSYAFLCIYI